MILLTAINAKYIHSNLAVYCLKTYAKDLGAKVKMAEYTINHTMDYILQEIYEQKPSVVAFSCYIWNIQYVTALAADLKKVMPELTIVAGGPEVSYDAPAFLRTHKEFSLVMVGEGEKTFYEYAKYAEEGVGTLSDIKGIVYRNGDEIVTNESRPCMSLDEVPFPYEDLTQFANRIIYYETSRGCPFSCSYCLSSIDKTVRLRSFRLVEKELQFFMDHKVPQVKFVDRTFNCNHEHAYEIWKWIGDHDNGVTNFHFEVAADLLREEDFLLFDGFRKGLIQLEIGVQTTNPHTIDAIHRRMDLEKVKTFVERIRKGRNIHQHLDLIAGLPNEDYASFRRSFNEVYAMKPDQLQLGFLKVLKGSYMAETTEENELLFHQEPPYEVLRTKWLSYDDVIKLKSVEEMVEVYYNSLQYDKTMWYLLKFHDTPFDLYEKLGEFYKQKGLDGVLHGRVSRYVYLYEYGESIQMTDTQLFQLREVLAFDYYQRENAKKRPDFAPEVSPEEHRRTKAFFEREGNERKYLPSYEGLDGRQLFKMCQLFYVEEEVPGILEKGHYLFDYKERNPLNNSAAVRYLSDEEMGGFCDQERTSQ